VISIELDAATMQRERRRSVAAVLNGVPLGLGAVGERGRALSYPASRQAWRIGRNELELFFADVTPADWPSPEGLAVERVSVSPRHGGRYDAVR
jgi:hypothetical protein